MSSPKVALVTGASGGIGKAVVERLVRAGRHVLASGRNEKMLAQLAASLPGRVTALPGELNAPGGADTLFEQALAARQGQFHELVCAAGIVRYAPVGSIREEDLRAQLEVNFVSAFLLAQRAAVHMQAQGAGAIVLVSSTLGDRPAKLSSAYAASKAALINMGKAFALELAPKVRVNVVSPGIVDTPMVRVSRDEMSLDAEGVDAHLKKLAGLHPLGRTGTPEEVADVVVFALGAEWMTGSVLTIDGGIGL